MTDHGDASQLHRDQPPILVDRDRERALLGGLLDRLLAGHGGLVLIGGEAGIGKTTLVGHLTQAAAGHGVLVLSGGCYDLITTRPYGPWVEITAAYPDDPRLPPLPEPLLPGSTLAGVASQQALFDLVIEFLASVGRSRPTLLVLEDLHWADAASLDLLRVVARTLSAMRVLLVATWRDEDVTRGHPLYQLLPVLARETAAERIGVGWFDPISTRALIADRYQLSERDGARLAAHVQARSQGNPFFLLELLRALEDDRVLARDREDWVLGDLSRVQVPPLVRQVIDARLDRLGPDLRAALQVAAVIGQDVDYDLWCTVSCLDDDLLVPLLERALAAHLLVETADGTRVRFSHALVRETLYASQIGPRRRRLHRRVAEHLVASGRTDPDEIAHHFQAAGDARASDWLLRAGERAQAAYAWLTAADRFEVAAHWLEGDAARALERGWLLVRTSLLRRYVDPGHGVLRCEAAARVGHEHDDPILAACATCYAGSLTCLAGDLSAGTARMAEGVAMLDALTAADQQRFRRLVETGVTADELAPRATLMAWLASSGRFTAAQDLSQRVLATLPTDPDERRTASTHLDDLYNGLGIVHSMLGRPDDARDAWQHAAALYRTRAHSYQASDCLWSVLRWVILPCQTDRLADRRMVATAADEVWSRARDAATHKLPPSFPLLVLEGRWGEARALLPPADMLQHYSPPGLRGAARLLGLQGDSARAWAFIHRVLPAGQATPLGSTYIAYTLETQQVAASLALDDGDRGTARAWIETHDRWLAWSGSVLGRAEGALLWARYHATGGDLPMARVAAERGLTLASDPCQPLQQLAAHRVLGELATQAVEFDDARQHLDAALAIADACAAPYERALTLLALAKLQAALGQGEEARRLLAEVRAICEPLDAQPTLDRAADLLDRLTSRPARAERPGGLSPREVEVLRLIAAGLNNPEIAAELYLSVRTIERHITNLYTKIGARNRADATTFAIRHGLV